MFNSIFSDTTSSVDLKQILICSLCAIIYGFLIAITHRYTSKTNKNFLTTITILPFLVQMIILMVNGNLGTSVAIVGAFSLVRFRSMPGTSKEILVVFFAMTIGLSLGMGSIGLGAFITFIGCFLIFLLYYFKLFDNNNSEKILKITIPEDLNYMNLFDDEFEKYTKRVQLEKVKTMNMGSLFELSYRVVLKNNELEKNFIDDLRIKNGNLKIMISQSLDDCEL